MKPTKFGHVWTSPETPGYVIALKSVTGAHAGGSIKVSTRSYDGTETTSQTQEIMLAGGLIAYARGACWDHSVSEYQ